MEYIYDASVLDVKGIGEKTGKLFDKLGVHTMMDMLLFFPRTYTSFEEPKAVKDVSSGVVAIYAMLKTPALVKKTRSMDLTIATAFSDGVAVEMVWFRAPYVRAQLDVGKTYIFYGKLEFGHGKYSMKQPVIYEVEKYRELMSTLQPVYHLVRGLNNNLVKKSIKCVLQESRLDDERIPKEIVMIVI